MGKCRRKKKKVEITADLRETGRLKIKTDGRLFEKRQPGPQLDPEGKGQKGPLPQERFPTAGGLYPSVVTA